MPILLALFGPKRGLRIDIGASLVVGRSTGADIQLIDDRVSREHCRFDTQDGAVTVKDLGSQNGTFLNEMRLPPQTPTQLAAGDEIVLGDSVLVFDPQAQILSARFGDAQMMIPDLGAEADTQLHKPVTLRSDKPRPATLQALLRLGGALTRSRDLESAVAAILDVMAEQLPAAHSFVLQLGPSGPRLLGGRGKGDATMNLSRTLLAHVQRSGRSATLAQLAQIPGGVRSRSALALQNHSVAAAPVPGPSGVVGFLCFDREGSRAILDDDLDGLEVLAQAVGSTGLLSPQTAGEPESAAEPVETGKSPIFQRAVDRARAAARTDSTVLITGETGTGKEELARFIHTRSSRHGDPFVAINCGAIAESLAQSELFGHEKGAFTGASHTRLGVFESADGGTLFLDEVGELPAAMQVQLLRVLQERVLFRVGSNTPRPFDVRIIAATHRGIEVAESGFRQDLFYRLNVVPITLPPLRGRLEDLPTLTRGLLARIAKGLGRKLPVLSASALQELEQWRWPGNIRELANVLERMAVLTPAYEATPFDGDDVRAALGVPLQITASAKQSGGSGLAEKVAALERQEIQAALAEHRGIKSHAARALGISRPTLDKKIAELGLDLYAPAPLSGKT